MNDGLVAIGARKWKDKFGFHKVYVYDGLEALNYILRLRVKEQVKKQDSVYLVSGLEGVGKTGFTLWGVDTYQDITGQVIPINHVTRNLKELFGTIYRLRNNPSFLTLDEGAELDGTNSATRDVKKTKKKFTVMRKCSHIIFLCFVNPLRITTYFREDRVRGLFFVVKHGEVWFYSNNQSNPHLANIIDKWSKEHEAKSLKFLMMYAPDMILRGIPDYNGVLKKAYEERKDENIFDVLKEDDDSEDEEDSKIGVEWLDIRAASKLTGLGEGTLRQYYRLGTFNTARMRNRIHFHKQSLLDYVNSKGKKVEV